MHFAFDAEIIYWRGPAPYFHAPVPPQQAAAIREASRLVSYGWGVIPVEAIVGGVTFTTSLFPKDGTYLLPLKDAVRKPTGITAGDSIHIEMTLKPRR
jgi:hypothetical protein